MSLGRATVIFQGTQDLRYLNAGHDVGRPGCKAGDTGIAVSPKQVEVVRGDAIARGCLFQPRRCLVAGDQAAVKVRAAELQKVSASEWIGKAALRVIYATTPIGAIARDSAVSDREAAASIVSERVRYTATAGLGCIVRDGAVCRWRRCRRN